MTRRGFLKLLGSSAVVVATIPILDLVSDKRLILYGDGKHDDTKALSDLLNGKEVLTVDGEVIQFQNTVTEQIITIPKGEYIVTTTIIVNEKAAHYDGNFAKIISYVDDGPVLKFENNKGLFKGIGCFNIDMKDSAGHCAFQFT